MPGRLRYLKYVVGGSLRQLARCAACLASTRRRPSRRWTKVVPARDYGLRGGQHAGRTSAALYQRQPQEFRDLLAKTVAVHRRL